MHLRPFLDLRVKGALLAAIAVLAIAFFVFLIASTMPAPSPTLLRGLAAVNTSFVLAYAIEATWLVTRAPISDDYEELLGLTTGIGFAGLLAIPVSLLTAEHRAAGHGNFIDDLGLGWTLASLVILGTLVVVQPIFANDFRRRDETA